MSLSKSENPNIAATVFQDLRRQILSGELKAGTRLPGERELAARYGTNRNTLREAVRRLEQTRLVTVRHGQGVTVSDFRKTGTLELLTPLLEASQDYTELAHIFHDILPARLMVLEFAGRLAVQRADTSDKERLRDITEVLITATESRDPHVITKAFQRWLEALIDASHSVAVRWIANSFLASYRELLERFPTLWVFDPHFPEHLERFFTALEAGDEERAILALRNYYTKIDSAIRTTLSTIAQQAPPVRPVSEPPPSSSSPPDSPDQ